MTCSFSSHQIIICACACLGLGARTIVPGEAWVPAGTIPLQASAGGRWGGGSSRSSSAVSSTAARGAFACRSTNTESRFGKSRPSTSLAYDHDRLGWGGRGGGARAGASSRQVVSRSSYSSRGRRSAARPLMSMAEEEGGAEKEGYNAVLGALAIAGLGAVYYG